MSQLIFTRRAALRGLAGGSATLALGAARVRNTTVFFHRRCLRVGGVVGRRHAAQLNCIMTLVHNGRRERFGLSLCMLRSDFEFEGREGSMEYDWIAKTASGHTGFHQRFTYRPGIGFTDFDKRL